MRTLAQKIGEKGEKIALQYLLNLGYKILEKNYRALPLGEIDIIAIKGEIINIIEVKYYQYGSLKPLSAAIGFSKQKKIIRAARKYLFQKKIEDKYVRFDVLLITHGKQCDVMEIEFIEDAFRS